MPAEVSDRAGRVITHLRAFEGNVALFPMVISGCVLATRWIGLPVIEGQHFHLETVSLTILGYELTQLRCR